MILGSPPEVMHEVLREQSQKKCFYPVAIYFTYCLLCTNPGNEVLANTVRNHIDVILSH